jgi:hypothetical protein
VPAPAPAGAEEEGAWGDPGPDPYPRPEARAAGWWGSGDRLGGGVREAAGWGIADSGGGDGGDAALVDAESVARYYCPVAADLPAHDGWAGVLDDDTETVARSFLLAAPPAGEDEGFVGSGQRGPGGAGPRGLACGTGAPGLADGAAGRKAADCLARAWGSAGGTAAGLEDLEWPPAVGPGPGGGVDDKLLVEMLACPWPLNG